MEKPKQQLYTLSYSWYEEYSPNLLRGPAVEDWDAFCDSLLPDAVELALKDSKSWVGWPDIVDAMVEILASKGYVKMKSSVPEKNYFGSSIIREREKRDDDCLSDELIKKMAAHNEQLESKLYHWRNDLIGAMCPHCGRQGIHGYDQEPCLCPQCGKDIAVIGEQESPDGNV